MLPEQQRRRLAPGRAWQHIGPAFRVPPASEVLGDATHARGACFASAGSLHAGNAGLTSNSTTVITLQWQVGRRLQQDDSDDPSAVYIAAVATCQQRVDALVTPFTVRRTRTRCVASHPVCLLRFGLTRSLTF